MGDEICASISYPPKSQCCNSKIIYEYVYNEEYNKVLKAQNICSACRKVLEIVKDWTK